MDGLVEGDGDLLLGMIQAGSEELGAAWLGGL